MCIGTLVKVSRHHAWHFRDCHMRETHYFLPMATITMVTVLLVNVSYPVLERYKIFNGQSAGLEIANGDVGVYEENEVFDNKAGGICVATGCTPSLVANAESDNGQLLEDVLGKGQCLFGVSKSAGAHCYPMHRFYRSVGGAE